MDKTERHLNLIALLMDARAPVQLDRIREALYRDQSSEAFKRMFERDKEELRSHGLAIELEEVGAWGDQGYVIRRDEVTLPDLNLSPAEHAALMLASQMWGDGRLGQASPRVAAMKLSVATAEAPPVPWLLPHVDLRSPNVATITGAIERRVAITFRYRSSGSLEATSRTIEPHGIRFRGAWYVSGFDRDRDQPRMFKLDRIEGTVELARGKQAAFTREPAPTEVPKQGVVDEPLNEYVSARVLVDSDLAWWAVRRPGVERVGSTEDGREVLEVVVTDESRFVQWVLGFAGAAEVAEPHDMRAAVVAALKDAAGSL